MSRKQIYTIAVLLGWGGTSAQAGVLLKWGETPGLLFWDHCLSGSAPVAILCWFFASMMEALFCRLAASWVSKITPDIGRALGWALVVAGFRQILIWNCLRNGSMECLLALFVWVGISGLLYGRVFDSLARTRVITAAFHQGPSSIGSEQIEVSLSPLGWWRGILTAALSSLLSLAVMGWVTVVLDNAGWLKSMNYPAWVRQLYWMSAASLMLLVVLVSFFYRRCPKCRKLISFIRSCRVPSIWNCTKCDCRVDWINRRVRQIGEWYSFH